MRVPIPRYVTAVQFARLMNSSKAAVYIWKKKGLPCVDGFVDVAKGEEWVTKRRAAQRIANIERLRAPFRNPEFAKAHSARASENLRRFNQTRLRTLGVMPGAEDDYRMARKTGCTQKEARDIANRSLKKSSK